MIILLTLRYNYINLIQKVLKMDNLKRIYKELCSYNPHNFKISFNVLIDDFKRKLDIARKTIDDTNAEDNIKNLEKHHDYLLSAHKIKDLELLHGEILSPNDYVYGYFNLSYEEFCSYIYWRTLIRKRQTKIVPGGFLALYLIEIVNFVEFCSFEDILHTLSFLESLCENIEEANFRQIKKAKKEFVLLYGDAKQAEMTVDYSDFNYIFNRRLISSRSHPNLYKYLAPTSTIKSSFFIDNETFLCENFPKFYYSIMDFLKENNICLDDLYSDGIAYMPYHTTYIKQIFSDRVIAKRIYEHNECLLIVDPNGIKEASLATLAPDSYLISSYIHSYILRLYEKQIRELLGYRTIKISLHYMDDMVNSSKTCQKLLFILTSKEFENKFYDYFKK